MTQTQSMTMRDTSHATSNPFVGTWKLVSISSSESRLFGERPMGILIYDADGHVAVQIMRNPRPDISSGPGFPTPKEVQIAYKGYYAYYGTYDVNREKKTITHHLEGSLRPGDVGKDFTRAYEISGNRLALTPVDDSQARDACLTWERAT
ncbi:MAG TPA: lipocalin-like domain-containing protein [Candidatus Acidoferrales bacterium]